MTLQTYHHTKCDTSLALATEKDAKAFKCDKCKKPFLEAEN